MLSETLYKLRKQSGLSQEQLAEKLNVSRQSISKWESGISVPEADKLIAISDFFEISLDALLKEKEPPVVKPKSESPLSPPSLFGAILAIAGAICLILWGIISIFSPESSAQMAESSRIQIDGNAIFLILCILAICFGAWLLLKHKRS